MYKPPSFSYKQQFLLLLLLLLLLLWLSFFDYIIAATDHYIMYNTLHSWVICGY